MIRPKLPQFTFSDSTTEDLRVLARIVVYTVLVLWAALILGFCVRAFLWAAFG